MRAALVSKHGESPAVAERDEPARGEGDALVELRAAALNPVDIAIASGSFFAGSPPLPYVPGVEGVGTVIESDRFSAGTRVYVCGIPFGIGRDGSCSERFAAPDAVLVEITAALDDSQAVALGTAGLAAWLPFTWLSPLTPDDSVLVLGATGVVGHVGVQAAKRLGARRVVAVGRSAERLERARGAGADAVVEYGDDGFADRLKDVCADDPPTVVLDALWGPAAEAASAVAARGARILQLGQSAGPNATLASGTVRGKQLKILGYSNFAVPRPDLERGYGDLLARAAAGEIGVDVESMPLDRIADAWARQRSGSDVKLVVTP